MTTTVSKFMYIEAFGGRYPIYQEHLKLSKYLNAHFSGSFGSKSLVKLEFGDEFFDGFNYVYSILFASGVLGMKYPLKTSEKAL